MKTYVAAFIPSDGQSGSRCDVGSYGCRQQRWAVLFADFELSTQGDTLDEAFAAAQEALRGRVKCMLEDGDALPEPSDMVQARNRIAHWCAEEDLPLPEGTLFQMVPCAGMTRSGFLAAATQRYQA